jgi:hypothetical protein
MEVRTFAGRLYDILAQTTVLLRKGDVVTTRQEGPIEVVTIDAMPHTDEVGPELEKVDCELVVIGVDKTEAEKIKPQLIAALADYPEPDRLAGGPSYIDVGAVIGDHGMAFQLFALGKVLGLWDVITPTRLGLSGEEARNLAGLGMVMMTGWKAA